MNTKTAKAAAQPAKVIAARAQIAKGIEMLGLATESDDAQRARAYTAVLRDFVGAGGARAADGADEGYVKRLQVERTAAMKRLDSELGREAVAELCRMSRVRVSQIVGGGKSGTSRRPTGRPTGRPKGASPATTR